MDGRRNKLFAEAVVRWASLCRTWQGAKLGSCGKTGDLPLPLRIFVVVEGSQGGSGVRLPEFESEFCK